MAQKIRIQKIIAQSNANISRRKAEELIENGEVFINDKMTNLGDKASLDQDVIKVKGEIIKTKIEKHYYALYKPRGIICTTNDERGRKCITQLIKETSDRLYPVGRLDKDSEGLIFITNDGDFANKVMKPNFKLPKTYRVTVSKKIKEEQIAALKREMIIDGKKTIPAEVNLILNEENRAVLSMTIFQGINRQIRKMCESIGLEVKRLKRTKIGNISIKMLRPGEYRKLSKQEVKELKQGV